MAEDSILNEWLEKEQNAIQLLQICSNLKLKKAIDLLIFRWDVCEKSPKQIIQRHQVSKTYTDQIISTSLTLNIAKELQKMDKLPPCRIDIGRMALKWNESQDQLSLKDYISDELKDIIGKEPKNQAPKDVVLYGFGRIGRLVARRIIESTGQGKQLLLKAIVVRPKLKDHFKEAQKRASLFTSDSVHGDFSGELAIQEDGKAFIINGNKVHLIYASSPSDIDYTAYGINDALVIDNTGVWRDREGLSGHLRPGAQSVILTAPGKGDVPNIVYGVNQKEYNYQSENILSAASCTTNAIVPVLSILENQYGIEKGHVETIHAYTNDQNLLDNFHKKERRGRGAPINMVLTSTGAANAVSKVIPSLAGRLTGNAIRVPTPNVSMAILNVTLKNSTNLDELLQLIKDYSFSGDLAEQINYSDSTEYVSSNAIGMTTTSVLDAPSTIISADEKTVNLYLWYDNEYGYSCQVVRLAKLATGVNRHVYY